MIVTTSSHTVRGRNNHLTVCDMIAKANLRVGLDDLIERLYED